MRTKLFRRAAGSFCAIALLLAGPAFARQAAPAKTTATQDADPALWVVKDEDTTIYLFGTIHILKPGLSWFDEAVRKAFDESAELVTEIGEPDPAAMQGLIIKYGVNMDGPPLTERLPADKREAFAKALATSGLPQSLADRMDPWLAANQLTLLSLVKTGWDANSGADQTLTAAAKAADKPVSGLETVEQQFGFFDALSDAAQMTFLIEAIDKLETMGPEFDKMVEIWANGDADALAALMNDGMQSSPELAKTLLADRNARWAEWIDARLDKPGVVFMAVGAGHLAGDDSVQAMLAKRKIATARIEY